MTQRARKPAKRTFDTPESYLFQIDRIMPDYSFGIGNSRFDIGSYSEYAHTEIAATCLAPKKLAGRVTRFTLMGNRQIVADLTEPSELERKPNCVGVLTMRGQQSEYSGKLPFDALYSVSASILAKGLRFILLNGPPLQRGSSRIGYIAFKAEIDLDDY